MANVYFALLIYVQVVEAALPVTHVPSANEGEMVEVPGANISSRGGTYTFEFTVPRTALIIILLYSLSQKADVEIAFIITELLIHSLFII